MLLKENSFLNRYEWAANKVAELVSTESKAEAIILYDIGSRDSVLKKYLPPANIVYRTFDLDPLDGSAEKWDIEQPFPYLHEKAKIVTMLEVIEHLNNPWLSMKNVADRIVPGGYLVLTTPNPAWSNSRADLFRKGYLTCFTQSDLDANHHVFIVWPHIAERLLLDTGFEIVEYSTLDGKTKLFDKNLRGLTIPLQLLSRSMRKFIETRDTASCGMSYGIVARKKA